MIHKPVIKIDVVSDVICPWCYIGKRRLEKAIDQLKNDFDFEVDYHPFELNPDTPKEGRNHKEYLSKKFGGEDQYHQMTNRVVAIAATEGLNFDFNKQTISPNTLDAHRLIAYARREGKQHQMKEALMNAYFEKGVDLTQTQNLVEVAGRLGMNSAAVESFLNSDEFDGRSQTRRVAQSKAWHFRSRHFISSTISTASPGAQPTRRICRVHSVKSEKKWLNELGYPPDFL